MDEILPGTTSLSSCVVCGLTATAVNFGVTSCRACAKFFRRTHSLRKYYVCRQSDGMCEVRRDRPFLCRRCRFDKCLTAGMKLPKERKSRRKMDRLPGDDGSRLEDSKALVAAPDSILRKISNEYRITFEKRRRLEEELWATSMYGDDTVVAPSGQICHISTGQFASAMFPPTLKEMKWMYIASFPEFKALTELEQVMTISATTGSVYMMETFYLTHKHFPNSDRYSFVSTTSVLDNESCASFFPLAEDGEEMDMEELAKTVKFYSDKTDSLMHPVVRTAKLTETEYHATLSILFWSFDFAPWMPQNIVDAGHSIKKKIYSELNGYYKNDLKCADIAPRLGRLMMCVHAAQEAGVVLQEELQMYKLMGAFSEDDAMLKFFLS